MALLQPLANSLTAHRLGLIGGHVSRVFNQHADDLSHALPRDMWAQVLQGEWVHKVARLELSFVVHDIEAGECFAGTMSFARRSPPAAAHASR